MNTSLASVSVDSKETYVAPELCNSLRLLKWGDGTLNQSYMINYRCI